MGYDTLECIIDYLRKQKKFIWANELQKFIDGNYELTGKEKAYIISELFSSIDSCRLISFGDINVDDFDKAKFKEYDLNEESEFNLVKSIIGKLKFDANQDGGENAN